MVTKLINNFSYLNRFESNIVVDEEQEYFNATKLCKDNDKIYSFWLMLDRTQKLFHLFKIMKPRMKISYEISMDKSSEVGKSVSGFYLPRELFLDLSAWISLEIFLKNSEVIFQYFQHQNNLKLV